MRPGRFCLTLTGLAAIASCARAAPPIPTVNPLHEVCVRRMDLMQPMRLPAPWTLEAFQPAGGGEDASIDVMPSRICLRRSGAGSGTAPRADCTDLVMRSDTFGRETLPFQTIDDIHVAPIPDGHGGTIPALLVHATTSGGAHVTRGLFVWRFKRIMNGFFGPELFVIPESGVQRFFTQGPFNGLSMTVAAEWTTQATFADPRHTVFRSAA